MDFRKKSIRRSLIKPTYSILNDIYPHYMQFYRVPPTFEISYQEFEECTAERLAILQTIDEANERSLKGEEWRKLIKAEIRKQPDLRLFSKLLTATPCGSEEADLMIRRRDHISHFVLRLAYCDTEDKRRWFISREVELFKFRWMFLSSEERTSFLILNNFNYEQVSEKEKIELCGYSQGFVQTELQYFRVPFMCVSDLIRNKRVFLKKGIAYITSDDIITVLLSLFRSHLSQSLAYASRRLHTLDEDERIFRTLKGAGKMTRDMNYVIKDKDTIDISSLDSLCQTSYPLCMQHIHQTLRREHHLKHFSRLQYGLFLKGIGVTLEDSLRFWRQEFTKKMDVDKFEKSYTYAIRYNYGKEGKKADFAPHSCLRVINKSVNPGDHHGCPYRHSDPSVLKKNLLDNGLSNIGVQEVLDLVRKGHYQLACGKYFQIKHGVEYVAINHPNGYFDESQRILSGTAPKASLSGKSVSSSLPSQPKSQIIKDEWENESGYDFSSIDIDKTCA